MLRKMLQGAAEVIVRIEAYVPQWMPALCATWTEAKRLTGNRPYARHVYLRGDWKKMARSWSSVVRKAIMVWSWMAAIILSPVMSDIRNQDFTQSKLLVLA